MAKTRAKVYIVMRNSDVPGCIVKVFKSHTDALIEQRKVKGRFIYEMEVM